MKLYDRFASLLDRTHSLLLLAIRLWGWEFIVTGWGKLHNHQHVTDFFTELGIPAPGLNAWFIGGLEFVGGWAILLGLFARPFAAVLSISMLVAYITPPEDRATFLNVFRDPDAFIAADAFFYWLVAMIVASFGPGRFSIDALFRRR